MDKHGAINQPENNLETTLTSLSNE